MKIKFTRTCRLGDTEVSITVKTSIAKPIHEYMARDIADTVIKSYAGGLKNLNNVEDAVQRVETKA